MSGELVIRRDYPWRNGGPDLALCFADGTPLPKQREIDFEPFKNSDGSTVEIDGSIAGLLTVTFVVGAANLRFEKV